MADTVKDPDEIWLMWEESRSSPGTWLLKRRMIKSFEIEQSGSKQYGLGVFEYGQDGWSGSTAFAPKPNLSNSERLEYIQRQRNGFLLWHASK